MFNLDKILFIYEFVISSLTILLVILFKLWMGNGFEVVWIIIILCLTRLIRFISLFLKFDSVNFLFSSFLNFVPFFIDLLAIILFIFYFFAALGQHLFGGKITKIVDFASINVDKDYAYSNFNDFGSSLLILFELMIVNNWNILVIILIFY